MADQDCFRCKGFKDCPSEVRVSYVRSVLAAIWENRQVECKNFDEKWFRGLEGVRQWTSGPR